MDKEIPATARVQIGMWSTRAEGVGERKLDDGVPAPAQVPTRKRLMIAPDEWN